MLCECVAYLGYYRNEIVTLQLAYSIRQTLSDWIYYLRVCSNIYERRIGDWRTVHGRWYNSNIVRIWDKDVEFCQCKNRSSDDETSTDFLLRYLCFLPWLPRESWAMIKPKPNDLWMERFQLTLYLNFKKMAAVFDWNLKWNGKNTKLISWWSWTWFILIQSSVFYIKSVRVTIKPANALHIKSNFNLAWRCYVFDSLVSGLRDLCSCSYEIQNVPASGRQLARIVYSREKHRTNIRHAPKHKHICPCSILLLFRYFNVLIYSHVSRCFVVNVPRKWFTCRNNDQMVHTNTH